MTHWQQGTTLELDITDLSSEGDGVGRWENRVVFVPDTVPGDRIQARLTFVKPTFGRGQLVEVLEASGDRIRPPLHRGRQVRWLSVAGRGLSGSTGRQAAAGRGCAPADRAF